MDNHLSSQVLIIRSASKMEYVAKFAAVAQMSHDFLIYTEQFCRLAITCPYDDETLKSLFWIGANYHHQVDLTDTSELDWREAIIRCLESVYPPSRTQPDPEPSPPPSITAETSQEPP